MECTTLMNMIVSEAYGIMVSLVLGSLDALKKNILLLIEKLKTNGLMDTTEKKPLF